MKKQKPPQSSDIRLQKSDLHEDVLRQAELKTMAIKLAESIKRHIGQRTQTQLAREIGVAPSLLGDWLASRRLPSAKQFFHLKRLADIFGISLEELVFDERPLGSTTLASTQFTDRGTQYRVIIERSDK